jgi:hypothetical protein
MAVNYDRNTQDSVFRILMEQHVLKLSLIIGGTTVKVSKVTLLQTQFPTITFVLMNTINFLNATERLKLQTMYIITLNFALKCFVCLYRAAI